MRVVNRVTACDHFRCLPIEIGVCLTTSSSWPFDKLHADNTSHALADFVDGNDARMIETSGFGFPAKTFQMRFGGPRAQANYFERDGAIETLLMSAINNTLTAPADFLQQLVVAKVAEHSCRSRGFLSIRCSRAIVAAGATDSGHNFVVEQTKATSE